VIPKNSRVQINRVVRNIGPALASGIITSTHKENEQIEQLRHKQRQMQEKAAATTVTTTGGDALELSSAQTVDESGSNKYEMNDSGISLYTDLFDSSSPLASDENSSKVNINNTITSGDDIYKIGDENSQESSGQIDTDSQQNTMLQQKEQEQSKLTGTQVDFQQDSIPDELLCVLRDEGDSPHLMHNAVIVPCCGYFVCCEQCKLSILLKLFFLFKAFIKFIFSRHSG
jgi:hypothetical protein